MDMSEPAVSADLGDRPIKSIFWPGASEAEVSVGENGITEITVDWIHGQSEMVPWFRVMRGDVMVRRCNAAYVDSVDYDEGES
jgi:hypothetical protein